MTLHPKRPEWKAGLGLWRHKSGNIALITAFVMIPLTFALGMAFDFTLSQTRKDQLDGIADAAALGAVTPTQMALACTTAATQSNTLFNGQEAAVSGVTGLSVTVSGCPDTSNSNLVTRAITVSYTGQSKNVFASLLGMPTLPISGHSTATSSTAPNIDFYLLLDTSPSMLLAATDTDIATLESYTQNETDGTTHGCAFGCHESNPTGDPSLGTFDTTSGAQIPCTTGGTYADGTTFSTGSKFPYSGRDNYDLAQCVNVKLRINLLRNGVQTLMGDASTTEQSDLATYRVALYETDSNQANSANDLGVNELQPITSDLTGAAFTAAGNITALEMYTNNNLQTGATNGSNGDMDTSLDADVSEMNTTGDPNRIPDPGNGAAGQQPQEVLFIVTDGLNDTTPSRTYAPLDWNGTICSAIKTRGIRIAVLYTQYLPLPAPSGWYEQHVAPALPTGLPPGLPVGTPVGSDPMALGAQQCASPGLFYEVSTNGDIATALQTLFQEAVQTARLLH
jgi:Flp pilus assembly protein TadG